MGEIWKRINQNSGGLVVVLMAVTIIVGPSVFVWTEVHVNSSEIRALQEDVRGIREDVRGIREEIHVLREDIRNLDAGLRAEMERNQQQLLEALTNHTHGGDGSAIFKATLDTGQ